MPEEAWVRIDLGANAPIETINSAISDLAAVCAFGSELQRRVSRAALLRRVLRDLPPEAFYDEIELFERFYPLGGRWQVAALATTHDLDLPMPNAVSRQLASYIREYGTDDEVVVRELHYANPLDVWLILAAGGVVLQLVRMIRDWSSERRVGNARAADVENAVQMRKAVRDQIIQRIAQGDIPIPEQWIENALTQDPVGAFERLSRRNVELPSIPPPNE
jgi:hypothetical protein